MNATEKKQALYRREKGRMRVNRSGIKGHPECGEHEKGGVQSWLGGGGWHLTGCRVELAPEGGSNARPSAAVTP